MCGTVSGMRAPMDAIAPAATAQPATAKRPVWLLVFNVAMFLTLASIMVLVVPVFAAMFAEFGAKLATPTQFLIDASYFIRSWSAVVNPTALVVVLSPAFLGDFAKQRVWFKRAALLQVVVLIAIVCCMLLPVLELGTSSRSQ
jgi:type II secretory pathway component PulF